MCYRCQVCNVVVPHGRARRTFAVYKKVSAFRNLWKPWAGQYTEHFERGQIEREYAVCDGCLEDLRAGVSVRDMLLRHKDKPGRVPARFLPRLFRAPRPSCLVDFPEPAWVGTGT